jgi:hypothetical protein
MNKDSQILSLLKNMKKIILQFKRKSLEIKNVYNINYSYVSEKIIIWAIRRNNYEYFKMGLFY